MIIGFWCPKCKKTIKKGTLKRGNVTFAPIAMMHTHKKIAYVCYAVERFQVVSGKCEIKEDV